MPFLQSAEFSALPSFSKPNDEHVFPFCETHCSGNFSTHKALFWLCNEIMLQLNTAAVALHTITKHILAFDTRDTCVLFTRMFWYPIGGVYTIKMFQGQIDISVVEDWSLLRCDAVLLAGWFDSVFQLLTPPQNISTRLHAPLHSPSAYIVDNSTASSRTTTKQNCMPPSTAHQHHPHPYNTHCLPKSAPHFLDCFTLKIQTMNYSPQRQKCHPRRDEPSVTISLRLLSSTTWSFHATWYRCYAADTPTSCFSFSYIQ